MRVIALAAVLFLLGVSASWGSVLGVSGSPTPNDAGHRNAGPTGSRGPTGSSGPKGPFSHVKTRWRATLATLPANAATGEDQTVDISSISCFSPGNCSAVGSYLGKAGHQEGLLLTEKAGHWATGVEAVLPANARPDPYVDLSSVACVSAGNCTAVGTYLDSRARIHGLLLTEKAGHWTPGVKAVLPADAASDSGVSLQSVSCASAGNCTAVGSYGGYGDIENTQGLLLTEKAGHWKRGVAYGYPGADINSVSCSSDGSCSAVGYSDYYGGGRQDGPSGAGLLLTTKGRKWRRTPMPDLGPSGGVYMTSVSCAPAGTCSAIGLYDISIDRAQAAGGVLLNEKAGEWGGVLAKPPKNATSPYWGNSVGLAGISCASPGDCLAVGDYHKHDNSLHVTLLTKEAGKWQRGVEAALPREARSPDPSAVSCASPGNCTVVGSYSAGAGRHGLLLTEIAGLSARGVKAPHFPDSFNSLSSVSCASPGNCGAVGVDWTSGGPVYGLLLDSTTDPCVVPRLKGKTSRAARHNIESHNCSVGTIKHAHSGTIERGHVISQAPRPGRHRAPGTKVDLKVSSGP